MSCSQVPLLLLVFSLNLFDGVVFGTPGWRDKLARLQHFSETPEQLTNAHLIGEQVRKKVFAQGVKSRQGMWDSSHLTLDICNITVYAWVMCLDCLQSQYREIGISRKWFMWPILHEMNHAQEVPLFLCWLLWRERDVKRSGVDFYTVDILWHLTSDTCAEVYLLLPSVNSYTP